jgi:hypothetical protein
MNITKFFYLFFLALIVVATIAFFRINSEGSPGGAKAKSNNKKSSATVTLGGKSIPLVVDSIYLIEVGGKTPSDYTVIAPKNLKVRFGEQTGAMVFENRSGIRDVLPDTVPNKGNMPLLAKGNRQDNRYLKIHSKDGHPGTIEVEFLKN